jgi:hypothetical protein
MKSWKLWIAILLVFAAGFTSGSVTTRVVTGRVIARILNNPDRLRLLVERRLNKRLRLDLVQRHKIDAILGRTQDDLRTLRQQFAPPFRNIMSNTQFEIAATLTPEQQQRFQRFQAETRALWQPR